MQKRHELKKYIEKGRIFQKKKTQNRAEMQKKDAKIRHVGCTFICSFNPLQDLPTKRVLHDLRLER